MSAAPTLRGRDDELSVIGGRLGRLRAGSGSVILVEAPSGMGKSRLIEETTRMASRLPLTVGGSAAEPGEGAAELAPLLRALFDGPAPPLSRALLADRRAAPEGRYWMLEDLAASLERAASDKPILVWLDDLQWADAGTVAALRFLPNRLASEPIAWLLATRPGESSAPLRAAFDQLTVDGAARIVLEALAAPAVEQVVSETLGAEPDPELLVMAREAGGNPFFLVELLLGLREEHLVRVRGGRAELIENRLPDRVSQGMRGRLARMSESARQLATVAASLGRTFSFAELAKMLDAPPSTLVIGVEQLVRSDVLREHDARLAFRHDVIREAVRMSCPVSVRRALDRHAVEVLLGSGALPTEVAAQLATSAEPGDLTAIAVLRDAARALEPSDPGVAAELSQRALALATRGHPDWGPLVAETTLQLHAAGRIDDASAFADEHLADVLAARDEAAVCLSVASMFAVSPDVRVAMSRRALALPELSATDRAQHWSRLVYNLVQAGRADESRSLMSRASAAVQAAQHPPSATILMLARDAHAYVEDHFAEALRLHEAAIRRGFGSGEANREWVARHWRCELLANVDRLDESIELAASGIVAAQRGRQAWAIEFFEIYRGRQLLQRGQIADARVALEGRIEAERPHQITGALYAAGLVALGRVAIHTADVRLRRQAAAAAELMREGGTPATRGQATWLLALLAMAEGDPGRALELVRTPDPPRPALLPLFPMEVTDEPQLVRLAVAAGDLALAESTVRAAQIRAERNPAVAVIAGVADHAGGLLHNDVQQLESACRLLGAGPRPLATASALEDLARLRFAAGDNARGIDALDRALILCTEAGATWDASRLRARMRRHGVRRRLLGATRPATGRASLTASELTVAQLVGQGLSNRDVAARLFVSPHTVSSHLRHVFTKLGVNSRVELARVLGELD